MERFQLLAARMGVRIREDRIKNHIHLTKTPGKRPLITYDDRLPAPMRVVGVGLMLGVVHFDWEGERFGMRFSPPWANQRLRQREREIYQGYRHLRRWLAPILVTDKMKAELAIEGRSIYDLCWQHDLPRDIVQIACGLYPFEAERIEFENRVWENLQTGW